MGNISTATESSFDVLESYFKKYPDVPKETILKQHMLSLGHWFSDAALDASAGALVKSYRLFSYDLVPMSEFKRGEHRRVPEHFVLLNGPYDMRPVAIQTSLSPYSPYLIDVVDGRLVLTVDGQVVAHVRIPKTPDYYFKNLPDGTPYHEIVAFGSFITIFRNCQYWGAREECKFCDINENARQMKLSRDFTLTAPVKSVADVVRVCEEVASDARKHGAGTHGFVLSGGTITKTLHGKTEADFYEEYIRAIKEGASKPRITFEVNARPREEVARYKAAGVDNIHFNMEVWDRRLLRSESMAPARTASCSAAAPSPRRCTEKPKRTFTKSTSAPSKRARQSHGLPSRSMRGREKKSRATKPPASTTSTSIWRCGIGGSSDLKAWRRHARLRAQRRHHHQDVARKNRSGLLRRVHPRHQRGRVKATDYLRGQCEAERRSRALQSRRRRQHPLQYGGVGSAAL